MILGMPFGSDPRLSQAQSVATAIFSATIPLLTQLMGFIDTIYEKLHLRSFKVIGGPGIFSKPKS
jgi:hypothetical protein